MLEVDVKAGQAQDAAKQAEKREARKIALQQFKDVGIPAPEQRLDAYSWQLSGGLRQRAMIAMALSCNPR